jgi:hypothetical protein
MPALFGILQLDRGEPLGYANVAGLIQAWLQDAGGFAMVGLVVYLLYAMATPTDKSQSERIRVPVSQWMVLMAGLALVCYAGCGALLALEASGKTEFLKVPISTYVPPPQPGMPSLSPPPKFETTLLPMLLMIGGTFALLGIGEPFARDMAKIARRNLSLSFTGVRRFGRSVGDYASNIFTARRMSALVIGVVAYGVIGAVLYLINAPGLFNIWAGWLMVAVGVLVCSLLILMLFEAEGPVWAIAKLSFKEAMSSQLLWILFFLLVLPFAFRNVWMANTKQVDEVRTLVSLTSVFIAFLLLAPSGLLASFYGIPSDIKNLNIYTVASKPVERFEIVLGRFFGYVALMTLVLIAMTGVALVLITNTSFSEKAREETYKARVPVRGKLEFKSRKADFEGTNVGREFDYRKYIAGDPKSPQRAIWHYTTVPAGMASARDDRVPVEFTFDIYRMTKGEQNRGVGVTFRFVTHNARQRPPRPDEGGDWQWENKEKEEAYENAVKALIDRGINPHTATPNQKEAWAEVNKLAEQFGFFEVRNKEVFDYAVMGVEMPTGLFKNAQQGDPGLVDDKNNPGKKVPAPRLSIYVKCESPGQLLGMAEPDLYLLEYEQPFALNYAKGMIGFWCWMCIVIGLAVACSTYLSGVLSLLATGVIFIFGFFPEHLADVASNRNIGGGPFESMSRLLKAEQPTAPLSESAGVKALTLFDRFGAWFFRRIQNLIPDAESFNWTPFVSEGFNINAEYLVVNILVTIGYLLPWGILAYYLMKSREVAA